MDEIYHLPKIQALRERALKVRNTPESSLVPVMEALLDRFPGLKLFSLPHLGEDPHIELGFRGEGDLDRAIQTLQSLLSTQGVPFEELPQSKPRTN